MPGLQLTLEKLLPDPASTTAAVPCFRLLRRLGFRAREAIKSTTAVAAHHHPASPPDPSPCIKGERGAGACSK